MRVWKFLKEFVEEVNFEKSQQTTNKHDKLPSMQRAKFQMIMILVESIYSISFQRTQMNVLSTSICVKMAAVLTQRMVSCANVTMVSCTTVSARDVKVMELLYISYLSY